MARIFRCFFIYALLLSSFLEAKTVIEEDKIPDLLFSFDPIAVCQDQAVAGILQMGKRGFRLNSTYAYSYSDQHLFKVSGEYLHEKLGFGFQAGRLHAWVYQYALGGEYRLCNPHPWLQYIDLGFNYSHAANRSFNLKLVPDNNLLNERRIAGADAFSLQAQSLWNIERGALGGTLFYDYVRYGRKYQSVKVVTGPGFGVHAHYPLWRGTRIHGNVELRRPYLFLESRLSWNMGLGQTRFGAGLFIESVRGFQALPSSTRFGIELNFAFGSSISSKKECCTSNPLTAAQLFAKMPAVYRPQVLAITDQRVHEFSAAPVILQSIEEINVPVGSFSFDASAYFSGGAPLMYFGSNFPSGLEIDLLSGLISGGVDASAIGNYAAEITVVNATGRVTQPVLIRVVP